MGRSLFDSWHRKGAFLSQSLETDFGEHPASKGGGEVKLSVRVSSHPFRLMLWLRMSGARHLLSHIINWLVRNSYLHFSLSPPLMKEWRRKDFDRLVGDYNFDSVEGTFQNVKWQDMQCTVHMTYHWGAFAYTFLYLKINNYYVFWFCVCSLSYPGCTLHAPCYIVICVLSGCTVFFPHNFINGTIFAIRLLNVRCLLNFSTIFFFKYFSF